MPDVVEGSVFTVNDYPFVLEMVSLPPDEPEGGMCKVPSWRPGVGFRYVPPDSTEAVCNGFGQQILTVVSVHKPGRYPTRVFYTRQWVTPAGKTFGRPKLHIATLAKFRRLASGYRPAADEAIVFVEPEKALTRLRAAKGE